MTLTMPVAWNMPACASWPAVPAHCCVQAVRCGCWSCCCMIVFPVCLVLHALQDIFMATVAILSVLVKGDDGALHVASSAPGAMKLWEGICQLLGRKMDMERKYIERLEGMLTDAPSFTPLGVSRPFVADCCPGVLAKRLSGVWCRVLLCPQQRAQCCNCCLPPRRPERQ